MLQIKSHKFRKQEEGVALLISIFVLLIISAVALAMVFASATESSLAGNYKLSTTARYAAMAGLEEARGRMLPKSPNYFDITNPGFLPPVNAALPVGEARYIINPAAGEVVAPATPGSTYQDKEFQQEYGALLGSQSLTSVSSFNNGPGPSFKWVRITPATEASLSIDVNNDGKLDNSVSLFYDSSAASAGGASGSVPVLTTGGTSSTGNTGVLLSGGGTPTGTGALALGNPGVPAATAPNSTSKPVYEITALAVVPGGGEKLLQYVVTSTSFNLTFPAALSLPGSSVAFNGANSNQWFADGQDGSGNPGNVAGCVPNPNNIVPAVGVTNTLTTNNVNNVLNGIAGNRLNHYQGAPVGANGSTTSPSVSDISTTINPATQTPAALNQLVQQITQNADLVIKHDATQADLPSQMSASNPQTVVVDGNFAMQGNFTGYGILVVTGNFAYSGTTGWKGIVLVVGDGTTTFLGNGGGNNEFDGAMMVATIKDANGRLLPALGPSSFQINGGGGNGVYYNSCWINNVQSPPSYKVLSFREIPYNN